MDAATTMVTLRVEYLPLLRKYQLMRYQNGSSDVLAYATSPLDLVERVTIFLRKDSTREYELSCSPAAWKLLTTQERGVLEGIVDLHKQIVSAKINP